MNDNVLKFIALIDTYFTKPRFAGDTDRETLWLRGMQDMLGCYTEAVLMRAAREIVKTRDPGRDGTMFPKPSECIRACDDAKKWVEYESRPLLETASKVQARIDAAALWSPDRIETAKLLLQGELGDRARREGWIDQLFHFAREHCRLPTSSDEINGLVRARDAMRKLLDDLGLRGDDVSKGLKAYGESLQAHTRKLVN